MWTWLVFDRRLWIVIIVSLAVTICGYLIVVVSAIHQGLDPIALTGDAKGYIYLGENLAERGVFSAAQEPPYYPESFRSPGYPAFLAILFWLFGVSLTALFAQALIVSLAPIFLYLLARPLHERAAFWSAIIFSFEPMRLFVSASFLSDALFTTLFLGTLAVLMSVKEGGVSYARAFATGLLLGICILVRPIAIFLPLLFAAYLVVGQRFSRRGLIAAFLIGVGALVVTVPWMYRNHVLFDSWNISSVGPANLMLYNAPEFLKWHTSSEGESLLNAFRAEQASLSREEALSLSRSDVFEETFLQIIKRNELQYAIFHVVKTIPFFISDGLRDTIRLFDIDIGTIPNISTALMHGEIGTLISYVKGGGFAAWLFLAGVGFWSAVTLLMGVGAVTAFIQRDVTMLFMISLIAYFALLTGPVSNARYRVPVAGLLIAVAALFISRWYDARHD